MRFRPAIFRFSLVALLSVLAAGSQAFAGWVNIKNDTKMAVVVTDGGKGRPITIQPGETYREYQMNAGSKSIAIANSQRPNVPIAQGKLTWNTADVVYTIRTNGASTVLQQDK